MFTEENYKQAIDIITKYKDKPSILLLKILKYSPTTIIESEITSMVASNNDNLSIHDNIKKEILNIYNHIGFVEAVKKYKTYYGCGLKEAKESVEIITGRVFKTHNID